MIPDEEKVTSDLSKDMPEPEDTEEVVPDKGEDIEFECGIIIRSVLDGGGMKMDTIMNGCARPATNEDYVMLISRAHAHIMTNLAMAKIMNQIMEQAQSKPKIVNPKFGIRAR